MEAPSFGEVLEAVGKLSPGEQETLLVVGRRQLLAQAIQKVRQEFEQGRSDPTTVADPTAEILP